MYSMKSLKNIPCAQPHGVKFFHINVSIFFLSQESINSIAQGPELQCLLKVKEDLS